MAKQKVVVFRLNKVLFGIPISLIKEIMNPMNTFKVPNAPETIVGLISVRGVLHIIVNLRSKFNLPDDNVSVKSRMLLIRQEKEPIGFVVDEVMEIAEIDDEEKSEIPANVGLDLETTQHYLESIVVHKNRLILIMNSAVLSE